MTGCCYSAQSPSRSSPSSPLLYPVSPCCLFSHWVAPIYFNGLGGILLCRGLMLQIRKLERLRNQVVYIHLSTRHHPRLKCIYFDWNKAPQNWIMCLDSEMHTCAEVKFIQKLRVGGLLHSNHLILTNNAELSNKKIDYKENCFHARDSIDERITVSPAGLEVPSTRAQVG